MSTLSNTHQLLSDLERKTKILIKIIPKQSNNWNEWFIQCAKENLRNIQMYSNIFSGSSITLTQQYFSLNNILIHLDKLIKSMKEVREKTSHRIKPMSYEAWKEEQMQAYVNHNSLLKPNLSKEKYAGYKLDCIQARHYWEEEMMIANDIMHSDGYKGLETICKQLHDEAKNTAKPKGKKLEQKTHKRTR